MGAFAAAVFFLIITPGPGVLTTAGIGAAFGYRPGLQFLVGLFIGTNLTTLAVASGLAAAALALPGLRFVLLIGSTGYLAYLAVRIALSGAKVAFIESRRPPGILNGILLQFINPKAYAVNTVLLSGFEFWAGALWVEVGIKMLIMNLIWVPVHLLWLAAGVSLRRLDLSSRTQRIINVLMALAMLAVVMITLLAAGEVTGQPS
jgi:threonine/homoserine/homoserine lactone efflux protein